MNSSISSSDGKGAAFLKAFCGIALGVMALTLVFLVVLDPYGTGRLTPIASRGVPETGPRMVNANRLADPAFDSVIIGNSTIQLLSPVRLTAATDARFVQLSIPGTGPQEQTALVQRLFATRGASVSTVVLGLEQLWCNVENETRLANPFPFWLYSLSDIRYALGLFRYDTLEFLPRRIRLLMGREQRARPDGFWDYEQIAASGRPVADIADIPAISAPINGRNAATPFLERLLAAIPANTAVVLVHPPVFVPTPPRETDEDRRRLANCKAELATVARGRPNTTILDFRVDNELTRNRALFLDHHHYRGEMAMHIEESLTRLLKR
jgi:hypothetical protein